MTLKEQIAKYIQDNPTFDLISLSNNRLKDDKLHPLFIGTQLVIDKFISMGCKRVAIVMPDIACDVFPMLLVKYFSSVQSKPGYAGSVLDNIKEGKHLRLEKAVVEFIGIDYSRNEIKFKSGRTNPVRVTCPINGVHHLFEVTEGALSKYDTWVDEKKKAEKKLQNEDEYIKSLAVKRTALNKSIVVLCVKKSFYNSIEDLKINSSLLESAISYGEIDLNAERYIDIKNRGRLRCTPSFIISSKCSEIRDAVSDDVFQGKIDAIYCTKDKIDSLVEDSDFEEILKTGIPFITFITEKDYDQYRMLDNLGFKVWHWKLDAVKNQALAIKGDDKQVNNNSFFGNLSLKINNILKANFECIECPRPDLKELLHKIWTLSKATAEKDKELRHIVRSIWGLFNELTEEVNAQDDIWELAILSKFEEICDLWNVEKASYGGQDFSVILDDILEILFDIISFNKPTKIDKLLQHISMMPDEKCKIVVLTSHKCERNYVLHQKIIEIKDKWEVIVQSASNFYEKQRYSAAEIDYLFVTWFDSNEYIDIKQTYSYNNLVYILYSHEKKWKDNLENKIRLGFNDDNISAVAEYIGISDYIECTNLEVTTKHVHEDDYKELSDHKLPSKILSETIKGGPANEGEEILYDCVQVLLSKDRVAYFSNNHELIDVTALHKGWSDEPYKKLASKLKRGDKILVRQSKRDIIREKAAALMAEVNENYIETRNTADLWSRLLQAYSEGKELFQVIKELLSAGVSCNEAQVRNWLSGDIIMPRKKEALVGIAKVSMNNNALKEEAGILLLASDRVYEAGTKVKSFHQQAGNWLSKELRNKAEAIKQIAQSSTCCGVIEDIGDVIIYTVEEVLGTCAVSKNSVNRIEEY